MSDSDEFPSSPSNCSPLASPLPSSFSPPPPSLPSATLGFSVAYWDGAIPPHSITCLARVGQSILSGSSQGQLVHWLSSSLSHRPRALLLAHSSAAAAESCSASSSASLAPKSPAVTALLSSGGYLSAYSDGSLTRWSVDGSHALARVQLAPLHSIVSELIQVQIHSRTYIVVHVARSADVLIVDSYSLSCVRKLMQPAGCAAVSVSGSSLIVATEDGFISVWDLEKLNLQQTTQPADRFASEDDAGFLVSVTHPARTKTRKLNIIKSRIVAMAVAPDSSRIALICQSHYFILDLASFRVLLERPLADYRERDSNSAVEYWTMGAFVGNRNYLALLTNFGRLEVMELFPNPRVPASSASTGDGLIARSGPATENTSPTSEARSLLTQSQPVGDVKPSAHSLSVFVDAASATIDAPACSPSSARDFALADRVFALLARGAAEPVLADCPISPRNIAIKGGDEPAAPTALAGELLCFITWNNSVLAGSRLGQIFQWQIDIPTSLTASSFSYLSAQCPPPIPLLPPVSSSSIADAFLGPSPPPAASLPASSSLSSSLAEAAAAAAYDVAAHSILISDGLRESEMTNVTIFLARAFSRGEVEIHRLLSSHPAEDSELSLQLHYGSITALVAINSHECLHNAPLLISAGSDCVLIVLDLRTGSVLARLKIFTPAVRLLLVPQLLNIEGANIVADDLIAACGADRSVRLFCLSTLSQYCALHGLDGVAVSLHRFAADLFTDRVAVRTDTGALFIFSLADSSLEAHFAPDAAEAALFALARQPAALSVDYLSDLRWANNSSLANQHPVTIGHTTPPLGDAQPTNAGWALVSGVQAMAATPLAWIKNTTKYLYKQVRQQFSLTASPSSGPLSSARPADICLIDSFDSFPTLHLTIYTLNLQSLAQQLRQKYSSLAGHGNDKAAVYKALIAPFLDFDLPSVAQPLAQFLAMRPPNPPRAFAVRSSFGSVILFPAECSAARRWSFSAHFTAQHNLAITSVLLALLGSADKVAHTYYSQLEHYYNCVIMKELPGYVDSCPRTLAAYALCQSADLQSAARFLLKALLARCPPAGRALIEDEFARHFHYSLPRSSVFDHSKRALQSERKAVRRAEKARAKAQKSGQPLMQTEADDPDPASALVGKPVKAQLKRLSSMSQSSNARDSAPGPGSGLVSDSELLAAMVLCYANIEDEKARKQRIKVSISLDSLHLPAAAPLSQSASSSPADPLAADFEQRAPYLARCFLRLIQFYHANTDSSRLLLGFHLLTTNFSSLYPHIPADDLEPAIQRLFAIGLNDRDVSVQNECQHVLLMMGERNAHEYLLIMGRHATNPKLSVQARKSACSSILNLLKTKFATLPLLMPLTVHILCQCMAADSGELHLRSAIYPATVSVLSIVSSAYSCCSVVQNASATRFAVVNNASTPTCVIWDLAAGKKFKSFAHKSPIACVQFSPDGALVATYCGEPASVFVWRVEQSGSAPGRLIKGLLRIDRPLVKSFSVAKEEPGKVEKLHDELNGAASAAAAAGESESLDDLEEQLEQSASALTLSARSAAGDSVRLVWPAANEIKVITQDGSEYSFEI